MKVDVLDRPAIRLASVRHVGSYMNIAEAFTRLNDLVTAAKLANSDTLLIGIYHDDPATTPEDKLRSDAAISIPDGIKLPAGLKEMVIPSGRYAHTTHRGPYEGLGNAWGSLRNNWLAESGEQLGSGMSYEVYRNTPMNAKPQDLVTDLYLPLK